MNSKFSVYTGLLGSVSALALLIGCGGGGTGYAATKVGGNTTGAIANVSAAYSANNSGVVVGLSVTPGGTPSAVILQAGTAKIPTLFSVKDLGSLGGSVPGVVAQVYGINASGQAVGYSYTSGKIEHGFFYDGATMNDIGVPAGDENSAAFALNNAGVAVGISQFSNGAAYHAWEYKQGTGLTVFQPAVPFDAADLLSVNNSNIAVGYYLPAGNQTPEAFEVDASGNPIDLGVVGQAWVVNDSGLVAGNQGPGGPWWLQLGTAGAHTLPSHKPTGANVLGVNNNGLILGYDYIGANLQAVSWTTSGTETLLGALGSPHVIDLNNLISASDHATYGRVVSAMGINDSLQICCDTDSGHAVILTPTP